VGRIAKEYGLAGGLGFLGGLAAVAWIEPQTTGGRGLLILICVVIGMVLGGIFKAAFAHFSKAK